MSAHDRAVGRESLQQRLRSAAVSLTLALIALIAAAILVESFSVGRILIAVTVTTPLWLGFWRLLVKDRRAYAWMTLAVIPYLVLGLTEAIANPAARGWAGSCVFVGFALFVALIAYLRATR